MRVPLELMGGIDEVSLLEKHFQTKFRVIGQGMNAKVVFANHEWAAIQKLVQAKDNPLNESASVIIRSFNYLIRSAPAARKTAEGRVALVAAISSIYGVDPTLGSRLVFLIP